MEKQLESQLVGSKLFSFQVQFFTEAKMFFHSSFSKLLSDQIEDPVFGLEAS